ncbi:MAG: hypothetical protein P1V97_18075 [Planctomycetota bacterium]|nr:hypothetical protein [Planctomycetota bacterium]
MNRNRRDFKDESNQGSEEPKVDNWPFIIVIILMIIGALAAINYFGSEDLKTPLTIGGVVLAIALTVILSSNSGPRGDNEQSPFIDIVAKLFNLGSDK